MAGNSGRIFLRLLFLLKKDFFVIRIKNNMKTSYIGILIGVAFFVGILWYAKPTPRNNNNKQASVKNSAGSLSAEENSFDFGTVSMQAGKVNHAFKIKNSGSAPVTLEKLYTSCMCTTALLRVNDKEFGPYGMPGHGFIPKINYELKPGEETTIEAVFDPAAHGPAGVGKISRTIILEQNDSKSLELNFSALVTP